jgi:SAM-dependent methyltransferase
MSTARTAAEFDEISEVYDATREPLEPALLETVSATLRGWGVRKLLEVGVGTGRVAVPLAHGFEITGVDPSQGMLARARSKGLTRLVRGSAYRLPFGTGVEDLALFVHVLHVLDDPGAALQEACRVARSGAAALVRPSSGEPSEDDRTLHPRRLVFDLLREDGVVVPERARGGPRLAERRLLAEIPPNKLVVLSERDVTEPLSNELALFERRASRWALHLPADTLARAVAAAREAVGDLTHTYHRVEALALWERAPQRPSPPTAGPEARAADPSSAT